MCDPHYIWLSLILILSVPLYFVISNHENHFILKKFQIDFKSEINGALNSTLSRTINTSMTTLVVLLIIFFFGGAAIKGFIFALILGILVGTYSSMFVATPLLVDLTKKIQLKN